VLDLLSAERVGLFLGAVKQMKPKLFPHLELAAVVGTMKGDGTQKLREIETKALAEAKRRVELAWGHGDYVLEKLLVPRKQSIADVAGLSIAYYESDEVKTIINPIGDVIFNRTRREHPRYEGQHIEGSLAELRRGTADFGVERVQ